MSQEILNAVLRATRPLIDRLDRREATFGATTANDDRTEMMVSIGELKALRAAARAAALGSLEPVGGPTYGPGLYSFRVGDMPPEVGRLAQMANPETIVKVFGENLEGAHVELNKLVLPKLIRELGVSLAPFQPVVHRFKPNNARKSARKP